jgi:hypothetical protein
VVFEVEKEFVVSDRDRIELQANNVRQIGIGSRLVTRTRKRIITTWGDPSVTVTPCVERWTVEQRSRFPCAEKEDLNDVKAEDVTGGGFTAIKKWARDLNLEVLGSAAVPG